MDVAPHYARQPGGHRFFTLNGHLDHTSSTANAKRFDVQDDDIVRVDGGITVEIVRIVGEPYDDVGRRGPCSRHHPSKRGVRIEPPHGTIRRRWTDCIALRLSMDRQPREIER